jgi:hypothetical protein
MVPSSAVKLSLVRLPFEVGIGAVPRSERSRRVSGRLVLRVVASTLVLALVAAGAAAIPYLRFHDSATRAAALSQQLSTVTAQLGLAEADARAADAVLSATRARLAETQKALEKAQAAKVRTVVETKTITKKVPRWIPNGDAITVELTGFEAQIGIHDVQITHAYGFTDLIGIAVNKSDETVSYAQLGCTFLNADGAVIANGIVNKQSWAPGQSWGFTCSAQVDATGGILRVDEMS